MNLKCATATINETVQLAVASLNAPESVKTVLDGMNFFNTDFFIWILLDY